MLFLNYPHWNFVGFLNDEYEISKDFTYCSIFGQAPKNINAHLSMRSYFYRIPVSTRTALKFNKIAGLV